MNQQLTDMVLASVEAINEGLDKKAPIEMKGGCPLYGGQGWLDSISLVSLVVELEQRIEDEFDCSVILANEKAMSQRSSPFLTVASLANYCEQLLNQEKEIVL